MIPLRDTIPSRRVPWVMRILVALNIAVFALELAQGAGLEPFIFRFGVVPAQWAVSTASDLLDWPQLFLRLLTSQFLHGGFLHVASNMLYLWIFGDNVEDRLGHARFALFYLACGVAAAVAQLLLSPRSNVPMIGASGAIAGVLGAYFLMFPSARIVTLVPLGWYLDTVQLPAFVFLGLWFLLQWVYGLGTIGRIAEGGVAFWAHVGGFAAGMAGSLLLGRRARW